MGQVQFNTFQSDVLSFELREAMLGILYPGRYCGYDTMQANGSPNGTIPIKIIHTGDGVKKGSKVEPPTLGDNLGVAVSTQGTIIHEDQDVIEGVTKNTVASVRYDIIYMEHEADLGTPGANPATYGRIQGTAGSGLPSLTNSEKRIILGYIELAANADEFAELTWHPSVTHFGDNKIFEYLLGSNFIGTTFVNSKINALSGLANAGALGDRVYAEENYITDKNPFTDSIDDLDIQAKVEETARIAIGNRAIDSGDWGALTDIITQNASTSKHGLLKKLSNVAAEFLNGVGSWAVPKGGHIAMRTGSFGTDIQLTDASPDANELDFSGIAASDADVLILAYRWISKSTLPADSRMQIYFRLIDSGGHTVYLDMVNLTTSTKQICQYSQITVPCDPTIQKLYCTLASNKTYLEYLDLTCVGWQTYSA